MRVELLVPDVPPSSGAASDESHTFAQTLDAIGAALTGANRAEDAFASGDGSLQAAVYERARADVALSVATATAQRAAQALQSIFNMQV
jgi:flagellar hook-basal body complex protein FliE